MPTRPLTPSILLSSVLHAIGSRMALLVRLERVSEGLFAAFVAETGQRVTLGPAQDVQELADLCSFKLALDRGLNRSGVSFWSPSALEELSQDAEVRAKLFEVVPGTG